MANNPLIFNAVLAGSTGGIHERWITQTQSSDYISIRNLIADFAATVDGLIPPDDTLTQNDSDLMQSITQGVLANRYLKSTDSLTEVARAIVALWSAIHAQVIPIPTVATGNQPGYLWRRVYANASSSLVGTTFFGETVLAATTITGSGSSSSELLPATRIRAICWGSGGAGCFGPQRADNGASSGGGSGSGGGARHEKWFSRADFLAAIPCVMTIPGPTQPNASPTTASTTDTAPSGSQCTLGSLLRAAGGGGGFMSGGTNNSGGAGGGFESNGAVGSIAANRGGDSNVDGSNGFGGAGAGGRTTTGLWAIMGGGAAGAACNNAGTPAILVPAGAADEGGGGGGGGGGYSSGTGVGSGGSTGGEGGRSGVPLPAARSGGGGTGGAGATTPGNGTDLPGQPGANGNNATNVNESGDGGGGGGGCGALSSATSLAGGRGGNGGIPAGGAGSGGGGKGPNGTAHRGGGGIGGEGLIVLEGYS